MICVKKLSDVVATNFTILDETQEGLLRGGFGEILPDSTFTPNTANNCKCSEDNCNCHIKCKCSGDNCNCGTTSGSTSGAVPKFSLGLF